MCLITLFASVESQVLPVPIAQIGSYAITDFATSSALKPFRASEICFAM